MFYIICNRYFLLLDLKMFVTRIIGKTLVSLILVGGVLIVCKRLKNKNITKEEIES